MSYYDGTYFNRGYITGGSNTSTFSSIPTLPTTSATLHMEKLIWDYDKYPGPALTKAKQIPLISCCDKRAPWQTGHIWYELPDHRPRKPHETCRYCGLERSGHYETMDSPPTNYTHTWSWIPR